MSPRSSIQYGPPPQRLQLHRSDNEVFTNFDEDVSSIRDGYTARVVSDAAEKRNRHLVNNSASGIAPVFRKASEEKSLSQLLEHLSAGPRRGTPDAWTTIHQLKTITQYLHAVADRPLPRGETTL